MEENLPFIHTLIYNTLKRIIIRNFYKTTLIIIAKQFILIFFSLTFFNGCNDRIDILTIHYIENVLIRINRENRLQNIQVIKGIDIPYSCNDILWNTDFKKFFL